MKEAELKAVLQAAFIQCEISLCPLSDRQKQILLQIIAEATVANSTKVVATENRQEKPRNPLDDLSEEQRQALIQFVEAQAQQNLDWKSTLLNDWLNNRDSGSVQFIRDTYGFGWINQVENEDLAEYLESPSSVTSSSIQVGDRLEVCNGLWEWVQEEGPCSREWYPCTVVAITEATEDGAGSTNCTIRFDNGAEFEIQGIYEWNCYYWRFPSERQSGE